MMVAGNNGAGMNIGFPDVCLTPAAPVPVPIPYPNLASHAMAVPFSPNIMFGFMPALNMAAKIPLTNGDNAGVAHPLFMQMGQFTMGNPFVLVNCIPAVNLLVPTTGNMMNNAVGAQVVPNVTVTLLTDAAAEAVGSSDHGSGLSREAIGAIGDLVRGGDQSAVSGAWDGSRPGLAQIRIPRFSSDVTRRVFNVLSDLGMNAIEALEIDLRGCPGGDAEAALRLADDFVEADTLLAIREETDGQRYEHRARQSAPYRWPLTLRVDGSTASAAELFAGALQATGRAVVVGTKTAGKGTSQSVVTREGFAEWVTVCRWLLPGEASFDGRGLSPSASGPAEVTT